MFETKNYFFNFYFQSLHLLRDVNFFVFRENLGLQRRQRLDFSFLSQIFAHNVSVRTV